MNGFAYSGRGIPVLIVFSSCSCYGFQVWCVAYGPPNPSKILEFAHTKTSTKCCYTLFSYLCVRVGILQCLFNVIGDFAFFVFIKVPNHHMKTYKMRPIIIY